MFCMLLLVSQAKRLLSSPHNGHQPGFTLLLLVLNIICPSCWAERHQKIYILKCLQICSSGQVTCHLLCVAGCWSWWRNGHNLVSWIVLVQFVIPEVFYIYYSCCTIFNVMVNKFITVQILEMSQSWQATISSQWRL